MVTTSFHGRVLALTALALAACSSMDTVPQSDVSVGIVNALSVSGGTQLIVDGNMVSLPGQGHGGMIMLAPGTHHIMLRDSTHTLLDTTVTTTPGGRHTIVFSGSGHDSTCTITVGHDTISNGPGSNGYHANVGSILLVNSAVGSGPYGVVIRQVGTDSVIRMGGFSYGAGSQPPPAPYGFYIPFTPGTYTIDITANPQSDVALAETQITIAANDRWVVVLTRNSSGNLVLTATKG